MYNLKKKPLSIIKSWKLALSLTLSSSHSG